MNRHGNPHSLATGKLRSYGAAMKVVGNANFTEIRHRPRLSPQPFQRGAPSLQPIKFQAEPRRRSYRVAQPNRLRSLEN